MSKSLDDYADEKTPKTKSKAALVGKVADLIQRSGIDVDEIGRIDKIVVGDYQAITKDIVLDEDGNTVTQTNVHDLEKAHIVAHASGGHREADNLILLCSEHHVFFDCGVIRLEGTASSPVFLDREGRNLAERGPGFVPDFDDDEFRGPEDLIVPANVRPWRPGARRRVGTPRAGPAGRNGVGGAATQAPANGPPASDAPPPGGGERGPPSDPGEPPG